MISSVALVTALGATSGRGVGADADPEFSGEISVSRRNLGAAGWATAVGPTD